MKIAATALLLLLVCLAAALLARMPSGKRALLWPLGFILLYAACIGPLPILLPFASSSASAVSKLVGTPVLATIAIALAYRPNRALFLGLAVFSAASVIRYVLAFAAADRGSLAETLVLLREPFWVATLVGQLALLAGAVTLAGVALRRPDIFHDRRRDKRIAEHF